MRRIAHCVPYVSANDCDVFRRRPNLARTMGRIGLCHGEVLCILYARFVEVVERPDDATFFRDVTRRICGSLDIDRALWRCLLYLQEHLPADWMNLNVFDASLGTMNTVAQATKAGGSSFSLPIPLPADAREALTRDEWPPVVVINRPETNPVSRSFVELIGSKDASILVLRLMLEGERLGTCVIQTKGRDQYTTEHANLVSLINDPVAIALSNHLRYRQLVELKEQLADDCRYFQAELRQRTGEVVVGAKLGLRHVMEIAERVAPTTSPVLLLGETGVGKDVVAAAIHSMSPRHDGAFVKVNCGAMALSLVDSELFGHDKGAFTGAVETRRGRFERAIGGTIFLDEVGELHPEAQVRLLHVLQSKEIERVGGSRPVPVDVRVIAATNQDLASMVASGDFRQDLYYRLNVLPIPIPPLRERKEDIPALVEHFLRHKSLELRVGPPPALAPGTLDRLMAHDWPGNVRELEHTIERALILSRGQPLAFDDFSVAAPIAKADGELSPGSLVLDEVVRSHIRRVLDVTDGRIEGDNGAAKVLSVNPSTLRKRMRKLGIRFGR